MKKEYIMPEVNVVKIHAERMLAGGSDPDTTSMSQNGETNGGFADARSFDFDETSEEE